MSKGAAQLAKSAGIISIATFCSRILGLVREQVIAHLFPRYATDAFYVAFRIPNLLRDLFAEGALSSAFIPTFAAYLTQRGRAEAWKLASMVVNLLLVILSATTLVGIVFSDWIVMQFAGSYTEIPGKFELTVLMTRLMFPFLPIVALAAVAMGVLNSQGKFLVPAMAPALFNVGSLVTALALYRFLPDLGLEPILAMAVGTVVGGSLQLLVQVPQVFRQGFEYILAIDLRHSGVRRVLLLMGPGTIGLAATQINIFVNTWLATGQEEGAVSWLNYAFRLMQFPIGVFGVAIAAAALPTISAQVARKELQHLRDTLSTSLRMGFALNIPASFGLIFLSQPIIQAIYEHGRFTATDTLATAKALVYYALGLFAYSAIKILVPAFYSLGRSRVPVIVSSLSVALNIVLNLALVGPMGYSGLALGTSVTSVFNFLLLFGLLQRYTGGLEVRPILSTFVKAALASTVMGLCCYRFHRWFFTLPFGFSGIGWQIVSLGLAIGLGMVVLLIVANLLRMQEVGAALQHLREKVRSLRSRT
ncbi:MAG: murein biosynthesis integral membrane protein MurJ [Acidobacteriota bacterium]